MSRSKLSRPLVVALGATVLTLAALSFGTAPVHAGFPCSDDQGSTDLYFDSTGITYVGIEAGVYQPPTSPQHGYLCVAPTGGEANQSWFRWDTWNPSSGTGVVAQVTYCSSALSPTCPARLLGPTGAAVDPTPSVDAPGGGTVGGGVDTACTYVHSNTPTCVPALAVTLREGDLPQVQPTTTSSPPPCTGVNNTCPGVRVIVGGDKVNPTVSGAVTANVPYNCIQVNSTCPTS